MNPHLLSIWNSISESTDTWDYFWLLSIEAAQGKIIGPKNRLTKNFGFDSQATHKRLKSWQQDEFPIKVELKSRPKYDAHQILDQLFESLYFRNFRGFSIAKMFWTLNLKSFFYLLQKIILIFIYEKIAYVYLRVKKLLFPK